MRSKIGCIKEANLYLEEEKRLDCSLGIINFILQTDMENTNTRTDFATMVGLVMGAAIITLGIVTGGGEYMVLNLNSLLIVIGGTFAATMVNHL